MGDSAETTRRKGTITNHLIYSVLMDQVMPTLGDIQRELARLNGRVHHVEDLTEAQDQRLTSVEGDCTDLSTRLGRVEGAGSAQAEQIRDVKERHAVLDNRVLQVAIEVAKWGAVGLGLFTGLAQGLAAIAEALRP